MEITKPKTRVVGVDISLAQTTLAIVDVRGHIIAKDTFPTEDYKEIGSFIGKLCEQIVLLAEANGGIETIRSIGISAPSANAKTGCIENAPNMPWKGVIPLAALVRDQLGLAVALGNDCQVIALGEHAYGSAHGLQNFGIITIGHGVGSATYTRGKLHVGHHGYVGEVGHSCVVDHGRECGCGLRGCLESYVAAKGIVATAKELLETSGEPSLLRDLAPEGFTPKSICACCERGDQIAIETYKRTGYMLGMALANYAAIIDPEAIVLTGGIVKAGKWLLGPAEESFENHLFPNLHGRVKLLLSSIDDRDRDVLGASVLAWEVEEYSLFK